jgi:hypothetical protein
MHVFGMIYILIILSLSIQKCGTKKFYRYFSKLFFLISNFNYLTYFADTANEIFKNLLYTLVSAGS